MAVYFYMYLLIIFRKNQHKILYTDLKNFYKNIGCWLFDHGTSYRSLYVALLLLFLCHLSFSWINITRKVMERNLSLENLDILRAAKE